MGVFSRFRDDGVLVTDVTGDVDENVAEAVFTTIDELSLDFAAIRAWLLNAGAITSYTAGGVRVGASVLIRMRARTRAPIVLVATTPVVRMAAASVSLSSGARLHVVSTLADAEAAVGRVLSGSGSALPRRGT